MKLMYFLRGVGVGIVFCALILFVAYKTNPVKMSDEDVIKKAKELGMVEADAVTDPLDELLDKKDADQTTEVATTEKKEEKTTEAATTEAKEEKTTEAATTEAKEEKTTEAATTEAKEEKTTEVPTTEAPKETAAGKKVSFTVTPGMYSENVAAGLVQLGVVKDANDFNKYLCDNGYANRIAVGTYEFTTGEDYASIAKKITP